MMRRYTVVETSLNRVEFRWKWLRFLQRSFTLGSVVALLILMLGLAILFGWLANKDLAITALVIIGILGCLAWAIIAIGVAAGAPERGWLAAALERVDKRLLDRLNTLVFLERQEDRLRADSFARRIAGQVQAILQPKRSPSPWQSSRAWRSFAVFCIVAATTFWFYARFAPLQRAAMAQMQRSSEAAVAPEKPLELALPTPTNSVEQTLAWGEVRITDPGSDLRVTKVDVVPLQIEVAANQDLKEAAWYSTVNGNSETPHQLPAPSEPRYAAYQPTLYLDELNLSDWDLLTYYAKAGTVKGSAFASDVYFLEVRPFREDILKMPGGEDGKACKLISEISSLIRRQQHVVRQTHQHLQSPPEQENLRHQDRTKLAQAENDLGEATRHLYARMAAELENQAIGEALENLSKASDSLENASKRLVENALTEAQSQERNGLSQLVAARKSFQKAVTDNPKAFEEKNEDEPPPPVADATKRLSEIAEYRNERKVAQEQVKQLAERQKDLENQVRATPRSNHPRLSEQQRQIQQSLEDFQQRHPQPFKGLEQDTAATCKAMSNAAEALWQKAAGAQTEAGKATKEIQNLSQAMANQSAERQLADAYRLKQLMDDLAKQFDLESKRQTPSPQVELQKAVDAAKQTTDQLKTAVEQDESFGKPIRDALGSENKADLDAKLDRVGRPRRLNDAQPGTTPQKRAADAHDALAKVSEAFEQSEPASLKLARGAESKKDEQERSFELGISEMESLIKQLENNRKISNEDRAKQCRQALYNLQTGMRELQGDNSEGNQILLKLQETLKPDEGPPLEDLKRLLEQLRHFSVEVSDRQTREGDKNKLTNIDPSKLPPAYRGRIQKYFEKLSEE